MIRQMRAADMSRVLDIWLAGNLQAHPFIPKAYWQGQLEKMEQEYLPSADVFVYEDGESFLINGFIGIVDMVNDAYIAGLFVWPDCQGQGVGSALLAHGQEQYGVLRLNVYSKNDRAIGFYERNGFQTVTQGIDAETGEPEQTMAWKK